MKLPVVMTRPKGRKAGSWWAVGGRSVEESVAVALTRTFLPGLGSLQAETART